MEEKSIKTKRISWKRIQRTVHLLRFEGVKVYAYAFPDEVMIQWGDSKKWISFKGSDRNKKANEYLDKVLMVIIKNNYIRRKEATK